MELDIFWNCDVSVVFSFGFLVEFVLAVSSFSAISVHFVFIRR